MVFGWPTDDGSKPILLTAMEDIGLFNPLRLSSASDLHSRIKALEDATRACRAELQRRPSHCQVEPPLPLPAASSIGSIVDVLDPLCLQQVAAGLDTALELALCCQTCTDFRQACQLQAEWQVRALVRRCWAATDERPDDGTPKMRIPFQPAEEMAPSDADTALWPAGVHVPPQTDAIKLVAAYAGGWTALLAGRQGLLNTSPPSRPHEIPPLAPARQLTTWLIWDVRDAEGRPVWSGVKPLADELDGTQDEFGNGGNVMYPTSTSLPGGPCAWQHSFNDGARPSVLFASHRTDGWEVSVSIVGPDIVEMEVLTFRFSAAEVLEDIRSEYVSEQDALDSEAAPVLGVTRYDICGYRGNEQTNEDLAFAAGVPSTDDCYMHWDLTVWVDRRSDDASEHVALADASFTATDSVWPGLLAKAKQRSRAQLASGGRPAGGWYNCRTDAW